MTRTVPLVILATILVGVVYTVAINTLLGGSVEEAAPRVTAISASNKPVEPATTDRTATRLTAAARYPRLWRTTGTPNSAPRKPHTSRKRTRKASRTPARRRPNKSPHPSGSAPAATRSPAPPPSTSPVVPPIQATPSPKPKPTPHRGGNGGGSGGDFYSTG